MAGRVFMTGKIYKNTQTNQIVEIQSLNDISHVLAKDIYSKEMLLIESDDWNNWVLAKT